MTLARGSTPAKLAAKVACTMYCHCYACYRSSTCPAMQHDAVTTRRFGHWPISIAVLGYSPFAQCLCAVILNAIVQ